MAHCSQTDTGRLARWATRNLARLRALAGRLQAEAELRALNDRELQDLGLGQGSLTYAARHGREEPLAGAKGGFQPPGGTRASPVRQTSMKLRA